jgi:type VI secretion system secreted protein VgrG
MNLDIHDAVIMAVIITILGAVFSTWRAVRSIRKSRNVVYYRIRYNLVSHGWWAIVFAAVLVLGAILIGIIAEPVAYIYFPPSPTISSTPTISPTPTISLTPTITETPTITLTPATSYTPTITSTPFLPDAIEVQFSGTVTPNPAAVFSRLQFSRSVIKYKAVDPQTSFSNPVQKLFITYSYDKMANGVQWTMLWYREGKLLKYDTSPWSGGTGGIGEYELDLPAEEWLPGTYQVIFFVGIDWKVVGEFRVTGVPPSATPSPFPSETPTMTQSALPSFTPRPSDTRWPTVTK